MRKWINKALAMVVILGILPLGACSISNTIEEGKLKDNEDYTFTGMEEEAMLTYELPQSSPHILVDELGYTPKSSKLAFFYGDKLPLEFTVFDADTDNPVFTGKVEFRTYDEEYATNIAYGDFSSLTKEGKYYIEADLLGSSYEFSIQKDIYKDIFKKAEKTYYLNRCGITLSGDLAGDNAHNACHTKESLFREDILRSLDATGGWHQEESGSMEVIRASEVIGRLLMAYEIYPEAFWEDYDIPESDNGIPDIIDEVRYEIDWLMRMQNPEDGGVYSKLTVTDGEKSISYVEAEDLESSYAFAYALSKFSYIYQAYDKEYATQCLRAADKALRYAMSFDKDYVSAWRFAASSEIYRSSGLDEYRQFTEEYLGNADNLMKPDVASFLGIFTYLNSRQPVNASLCEDLMTLIMKRAEEISKRARESAFLSIGNKDQSDNTELLDDIFLLTLVDYVITNHEYDNIILNHIHYLLGRNPMSVCYIDGEKSQNYRKADDSLGITKQFENNSKLIFILSKVVLEE